MNRYMQLYLFIQFMRVYKCWFGLEYIWTQREKPQWNEALFANEKENAIKIEVMEHNLQEWNRKMRIKLEAFFRASAVCALAYII